VGFNDEYKNKLFNLFQRLHGMDGFEGTGVGLTMVAGIDVLTEVRRRPQTRDLPAVLLTSSQEERDLVETYQLGVNSFVATPIDFDGFIRSVADPGLHWILVNRVPAGIRPS